MDDEEDSLINDDEDSLIDNSSSEEEVAKSVARLVLRYNLTQIYIAVLPNLLNFILPTSPGSGCLGNLGHESCMFYVVAE